jgi:hypothetical protein
MQADGSGQTQLTFFNAPDSPMYSGEEYGVVAADSAWSPDGNRIVLYLISNSGGESEFSGSGKIVLLALKTAQA